MTRTAVLYDPLDASVQADPYPHYAKLRADAPVYFVESLGAYAVSRHADVRRVLHDQDTFSNEAMATLVARPAEYAADAELVDPGSPPPISIIGTDGDQHFRLRKIVNRAFTPNRIAAIEDEVRRIARGFVDPLCRQEAGDLQAGLAVPVPTVVIAELLGVDPAQRDDFRRWSEHMVQGVFEPLDAEAQSAVARSGEEMGRWLDAQIATRTAEPADDLISVLLRAEAEGGALTPEELHVFVFTLLVAGSITTAYLIGTAVNLLATEPARLHALRDGTVTIPAFVEETLRYDAPTQFMFRTATTDVTIAGDTIPAGATVLPLIGAANRDERVFAAADRFDPTRDASEHLTFGHGPHFCLGAALARLEARVVLEELIEGSRRLELAGPVEIVSSIIFRGPTRLPLRYR